MKRIWITRDGRKLKIKEMETSHINNCISMLKRIQSNQLKSMYDYSMCLNGEMAILEMEQAIEQIEEEGMEGIEQDYIDSFENELEKRWGTEWR